MSLVENPSPPLEEFKNSKLDDLSNDEVKRKTEELVNNCERVTDNLKNEENAGESENSQCSNSDFANGDIEDEITENISATEGDKTSKSVENDEWLDIIGSGDFKKRIIKSGRGMETRPRHGSCVTINYSCFKENVLIEEFEEFEIFIGELDVIPAFDLFIPLMEEGELAEVIIPSRLAYGKAGRQPDIPPDCSLKYEVEILKVDDEVSEEKMLPMRAMELGENKKERGNFWYSRGEYLNSITCYKRAAEILDSIKWDGNEVLPEVSQGLIETRTKVYNNMAQAQMKLESYDQALKSVDSVIRLQPKNCKARFRKGMILSAKGQTEEAIVEMKKAAELEPETKVIQHELTKLLERKKRDDKVQRAMYKRMFPSSPSKPTSKIKKWLKNGSLITGSCVAVAALGVAAYRQFYS